MSTQPNDNSLAPAAGAVDEEGVREMHPVVMWDKHDARDPFDFRGIPEEDLVDDTEVAEEEVDGPKDSSAPGSALAAIYEQVKTPDMPVQQSEEIPVVVVSESNLSTTSESGSQTSSTTEPMKPGSPALPA